MIISCLFVFFFQVQHNIIWRLNLEGSVGDTETPFERHHTRVQSSRGKQSASSQRETVTRKRIHTNSLNQLSDLAIFVLQTLNYSTATPIIAETQVQQIKGLKVYLFPGQHIHKYWAPHSESRLVLKSQS